MQKKKILGAVLASGFLVAFASPAFAEGDTPAAKCNAGRGNLSETTPATDCDPGNSGGPLLDADGRLIDPWGGRRDLVRRVLRHVSGAFGVDPLRVLRVARFAAQLHRQRFTIAPETQSLPEAMSRSGELHALRPERTRPDTHNPPIMRAVRWRSSIPKSSACSACRIRRNGIRRSTPAYI